MTAQPSIRRSTTLTRELTVLKRAQVTKANTAYFVNPGDVINLVKNGGGKVYTTILRRNKCHTCTCEGNAKWHKQCYHIDHCVQAENARWDAEKAKQALIAQAEAEGKVVEATSQAVVVASEPVVEIKEREKVWDKDRCCVIYADTREVVDKAAYTAQMAANVADYERWLSKQSRAEDKAVAKVSNKSEDAVLNGASQGFRVLR